MDTDVHELPIEAIVLNPELNLRDCLDEETVHRYAEAPELLPPVTVYQVDGDWLLADGFHRGDRGPRPADDSGHRR